MAGKNKLQLKKEFDSFAAKVSRLESLRTQFEALDTKGHEAEARSIKAQLNDIHSVDSVARAINDLKKKVAHRSHVSVEGKKDHAKMFALSRFLEHKTEGLQSKIVQLEKDLASRRKVSMKKPLSKEELALVHDIPTLEKQLASLKSLLESHIHAKKRPVDAGVGMLVDTRFDEFLADIKGELSQRLKEKEFVMDSQLKSDLKRNQHLFAEKYAALVQEFQRRYESKVRDELHAEVAHRFEQTLHQRLAAERGKLVSSLLEEHARRLRVARAEQAASLEKDYHAKAAHLHHSLSKDYHAKVAAYRAQIAQQRKVLGQRLGVLEAHEKRILQQKSQINRRLLAERRILRARARARDQQVAEKTQVLNAAVAKHEAFLSKRVVSVNRLKERLSAERARIENQLMRERKVLARSSAHRAAEQRRTLRNQEESLTRSAARVAAARARAYHARQESLARRIRMLRAHEGSLEERARKEDSRRAALVARVRAQAQLRIKEKRAELARLKHDVQSHERSLLDKKHAELKELQNQHALLMHERAEVRSKLAAFQAHERTALLRHKKEFDRAYSERVKNHEAMFQERLEALKKGMHAELRKEQAALRVNHASLVARELSHREQLIRTQLKRDYQERLQRELSRQELLLQQKKEKLEKHVMDHLKKVLS